MPQALTGSGRLRGGPGSGPREERPDGMGAEGRGAQRRSWRVSASAAQPSQRDGSQPRAVTREP